jgi:hypothetical protein
MLGHLIVLPVRWRASTRLLCPANYYGTFSYSYPTRPSTPAPSFMGEGSQPLECLLFDGGLWDWYSLDCLDLIVNFGNDCEWWSSEAVYVFICQLMADQIVATRSEFYPCFQWDVQMGRAECWDGDVVCTILTAAVFSRFVALLAQLIWFRWSLARIIDNLEKSVSSCDASKRQGPRVLRISYWEDPTALPQNASWKQAEISILVLF